MRSISVTIVDVLGVIIPGALIILGIALLPPVAAELLRTPPSPIAAILPRDRISAGVLLLLSSYAMGFLVKLTSIRALHLLTKKLWVSELMRRVAVLESQIETLIAKPELTAAIREVGKSSGVTGISTYAPLFTFAKRLIRRIAPDLWPEVERLEAEIRFTAGLFIPCLGIATAGIWQFIEVRSAMGAAFAVSGFVGLVILVLSFPLHRVKEVQYIYYLALISLMYRKDHHDVYEQTTSRSLPAMTSGDSNT